MKEHKLYQAQYGGLYTNIIATSPKEAKEILKTEYQEVPGIPTKTPSERSTTLTMIKINWKKIPIKIIELNEITTYRFNHPTLAKLSAFCTSHTTYKLRN